MTTALAQLHTNPLAGQVIIDGNKFDPHNVIVGQGQFRYRIDAHWPQADGLRTRVENAHDMAIDKHGNILMVTDHPDNNIIEYSRDGEVLAMWGTGFPGAHGIEVVEENGQEFIYIVDSGWILNPRWDGKATDEWSSPYNKVIAQSGTVTKLTREGQVVFTIGHPQTIDVYTPDMPFRPTDIAVAPNGDFYITDGYGSDYLLHYDSQGRFIQSWGGNRDDVYDSKLINTHGIGIDYRSPEPSLLVSSRAEQALKRFSLNGDYQQTIKTPGAFIHGPVFFNDHFIAAACWTGEQDNPIKDSGILCVFDSNNRIVSVLGGPAANYKNDELQPLSCWSENKVFNHCHGVCVDEEGVVYLGQWRSNNIHPFRLVPVT